MDSLINTICYIEKNIVLASSVTGGVRANILFTDIVSLHDLFTRRTKPLTIYKGPATDPSTKVKNIPPPDSSSVVIDLSPSTIPQSITFVNDPEPGKCVHCSRETKKDRIGIPVKMRDDKFHNMMIVDIEGRACNYSCAYAYLKERSHRSIYSDRIYILRKIFELCYPGQDLKAAPDPSLHKDNGGELDDDKFDMGAKGYSAVPHLKYRVCSIVYEQPT